MDAMQFTESVSGLEDIFTPEANALLTGLVREFRGRHNQLLAERVEYQKRIDAGELPDFDPATADIREDLAWKVAPLPEDLQNRQVEITGPVDRKMVINALNADVQCFMADFEDSLAPSWELVSQGQANLRDANLRTIEFYDEARRKEYKLGDNPALLIARVRGLHLIERNILVDGEPIPGCLMDFCYYLFHNHETLRRRGSGPYFYIPKLQSGAEAKWWNDVIEWAQNRLGLPQSTVRVTCLIETIPAVFQMHEILYALKDHIAALNCGRWDYIFSYIKVLRKKSDRILPDRQSVTMDKPFLNAYSRLLVKTCHQRGALAMGGMSAFIPQRDPQAQKQVEERVIADKELELANGHDGTWIAHPGLAELVGDLFRKTLGDKPNQLQVLREDDERITAAELLAPSQGDCTEEALRRNIRVGIQYLEAWIGGTGCVPIYGLMEDAATAEISRTSIWQWIQQGQKLANGKTVTKELFTGLLKEEVEVIKNEVGIERFEKGRFADAVRLFDELSTSDELVEFLTLPAYDLLD